MPEKIQRVPRGLNDLLSLAGGNTPQLLADEVRPILDLLQLYGLQQRQSFVVNGVIAENVTMTVTCPNTWCLLFACSVAFIKTATMTALRGGIMLNRTSTFLAGDNQPVADAELGPFGATETGAVVVPFVPAYPMLLPPLTRIVGIPRIIGTDATVNTTTQAELGILG